MSDKRIAVLISGNGSNLQAMLDACAEGRIAARVIGVIANKADAYGLTRAEKAGVATEVIDHRGFSSREDFDAALQEKLDELAPDVIVLAGFMRILTAGFVEHFMGRMLNIHPSLLPKYPGLTTHARALEAGDREHGCSVHFVTPEVDGGPVVIQGVTEIRPDDSPETLQQRVHALEHRVYPLAVGEMVAGRLSLAADGQALYRGKALTRPPRLGMDDAPDWPEDE